MTIIRVFPKRYAQYTPTDEYAKIGLPPVDELIPPHDEVHISCVFSWDKAKCLQLQAEWRARTDKPVLIGGPAFGSRPDDHQQGMYLKDNVTFASRGCNNKCPFCIVPKLEGPLRELPVVPGNWIQDNNFLQCTRAHKDKVFDMLEGQRRIVFAGGLQTNLIDEHFLERAGAIQTQIATLFIACDSDSAIPAMQKAVDKLHKAGFSRDKIHCYALIGDDMERNEARCRAIYEAGAIPRAQLYRPLADVKKEYGRGWNAFATQWSRPAATHSHMKKGTNWWDKPDKTVPGQTTLAL